VKAFRSKFKASGVGDRGAGCGSPTQNCLFDENPGKIP